MAKRQLVPPVAPPIQYLSQLEAGSRLVPEAHRCPICNPGGFHFAAVERDKCLACGGAGKVLGWRVVREGEK